MAGIIVSAGFLDPIAALMDITVVGTSCMQAAFKTKKAPYHHLLLLSFY